MINGGLSYEPLGLFPIGKPIPRGLIKVDENNLPGCLANIMNMIGLAGENSSEGEPSICFLY
jgi:hypothetical protein